MAWLRHSNNKSTGTCHQNVRLYLIHNNKIVYMLIHYARRDSIFCQVGILVAGGYFEGRLTMFYPFNLNYVMGIKPYNISNLMLGYESGWETTGWLPNERKVICC